MSEQTLVRDLSMSQLARLESAEQKAVYRLFDSIREGRVHAATSYLDLTPSQLADEYEGARDDEHDITESFTVMVITAGGEIARVDLDVDLVVGHRTHGIRRMTEQEQAIETLVIKALSGRAAKLAGREGA